MKMNRILLSALGAALPGLTLFAGYSDGGTITGSMTLSGGKTYTATSRTISGSSPLSVASGATTVIYVPEGITLNLNGSGASGTSGGYPGIDLPSSSTLIFTGAGTVNATGGAAANGSDGSGGGNGWYRKSPEAMVTGVGGSGGNGGGGAGAGIGGRGGSGGSGGNGAEAQSSGFSGGVDDKSGNQGGGGSGGSQGTKGGTVYAVGSVILHINSGSAGSSGGSGGWGGTGGNDKGSGSAYDNTAGGGGGGGGGGSGCAAYHGIGYGGSGGGGGGGGGSGATLWRTARSSWYYVGGYGGNGGGGAATGRSGSSASSNYSGSPWGGAGGSGGSAGTIDTSYFPLFRGSATVYDNNTSQSGTSCSDEQDAIKYTITFNDSESQLSNKPSTKTVYLGLPLSRCDGSKVKDIVSTAIGTNGWTYVLQQDVYTTNNVPTYSEVKHPNYKEWPNIYDYTITNAVVTVSTNSWTYLAEDYPHEIPPTYTTEKIVDTYDQVEHPNGGEWPNTTSITNYIYTPAVGTNSWWYVIKSYNYLTNIVETYDKVYHPNYKEWANTYEYVVTNASPELVMGWFTEKNGKGTEYFMGNGTRLKSRYDHVGDLTLYPYVAECGPSGVYVNGVELNGKTESGVSGTGWTYQSFICELDGSACDKFTITGSNTVGGVYIRMKPPEAAGATNATVNVTLSNLILESGAADMTGLLQVPSGTSAKVTLDGVNKLSAQGGENTAAIYCPFGGTLTLSGTQNGGATQDAGDTRKLAFTTVGSYNLTAISGENAAAIGALGSETAGDITFVSGNYYLQLDGSSWFVGDGKSASTADQAGAITITGTPFFYTSGSGTLFSTRAHNSVGRPLQPFSYNSGYIALPTGRWTIEGSKYTLLFGGQGTGW